MNGHTRHRMFLLRPGVIKQREVSSIQSSVRFVFQPPEDGRVFGVHLQYLVDEGCKIPVFIERLISAIELDGLYTVGLYRKAGAAGRIRQLVNELNTGEPVITIQLSCSTRYPSLLGRQRQYDC